MTGTVCDTRLYLKGDFVLVYLATGNVLNGFVCVYLTWVLWLCVCTDPTCLLYEPLAQVRGHLSADIE